MRLGPIVLAVAIALLVSAMSGAAPGGTTAQEATIVFVDVGQGDAVVMKVGSKVIVSDAGEFELAKVNKALEDVQAKRIDVAILGHPHQDHVKNFVALLAQWQVKKAVLSRSRWWQGTNTNKDVIAAVSAEGLEPMFVRAGQTFTWGGASWQFLNPPQGEFTGGSSEAANSSLAYLLRVNGVEVLFRGDVNPDAAEQVAERLAPKIGTGRIDVFLATHHGSKYGSTGALLAVARPLWAVLSTGPNSFHHPSPKAIARLKAIGATIWCTQRNGSITARISAGGDLTWQASVQAAPWWSGAAQRKHGTCVGR